MRSPTRRGSTGFNFTRVNEPSNYRPVHEQPCPFGPSNKHVYKSIFTKFTREPTHRCMFCGDVTFSHQDPKATWGAAVSKAK